MSFPTHPGRTQNGVGTHWPAVLCLEVCAYMVCIWSLQTCYMHTCIKSAYKRVNLSGHVLSHASWTHAQWHGHTLACSVVHRGYENMCASASMHNTAGQCMPMPLCVCPGCVGKHMPAYIHTHIHKFDARVHVA